MWRILVFVLLISISAKAAQPFTRDFVINESSGAAKINALVCDNAGFIWLATDGGLYNFNGNEFFKIPDSVNKPVTAVAAGNGYVIAGFADGSLMLVENFIAQPIHLHNETPRSAITDIKLIKPDFYFVATEDQGLYFIANNCGINFNVNNKLSDNFINCIAPISDNRLFLGTDNGINELYLHEKKLELFTSISANGLPDNIVRVIKAIPQTDCFVLGTQEGGLALYHKNERKALVPAISKHWKWGQVNDIIAVNEDHIWVSTESGALLDVSVKSPSKATLVFQGEHKLGKMLLDRSGNLWLAYGSVLKLFTAEYLSLIKLTDPYDLKKVSAIACDKFNTLWLAINNTLCSLFPESDKVGLQKVYSAKASISSLFADKYGRLWIGTLGNGMLVKMPGGLVKRVGEKNEIRNESILSISGTDKSLWLAGLNGVEEFKFPPLNQTQLELIKHHNKSSGIGTDYVYQLFADKMQHIWMATDGAGVCEYTSNSYLHWGVFSRNNSHVAYSICEDAGGDIWVGTWFKDLYRLHDKQWVNMMSNEGSSNTDLGISALAANNNGQLVAVFQRSILQWYPASHTFRRFNRRLNLGIDSTAVALNCICKDTASNIYVPVESGIAVFKSVSNHYDIRPSVKIVHTNVNQQNVDAAAHNFPYDQNDFTFHFKGVSYSQADPLNFRYMLKGYRERWISTNDETVTFPRLPPGKYTFIVQSSGSKDFTYAVPDSYTFVIESPYWRKIWFIGLVIAFILFMANIYIRQRLKRLRNLAKLHEERMEFEYEHLKSQVNPHFLFNSLNTLTNLIDENKESAVEYTIKLSDLYRNMLAFKDKDLVLLVDELEILKNYIYIQQSRFGKALIVNYEIPEIVLNTKKIIPMALQLLVENAIKHNIVSTSQPLLIKIEANMQEIEVRNKVSPKLSKEKSAGIGLQNISNRYKLLMNRPIQFGIEGNEFIVKLPLL
jgi:ligand-binding sensor domain-containing protein